MSVLLFSFQLPSHADNIRFAVDDNSARWALNKIDAFPQTLYSYTFLFNGVSALVSEVPFDT